MREQKGVTLVSLVVTIIVLIILATITINATLGENGIITIARQAKENMELAQQQEQIELNELYMSMEAEGGISGDISYDAIAMLAEFREKVAEAITNKGVATSKTDSVETVVENIGKLGEVKETETDDNVKVGEIVTGKNKEYTNNGTAVIPVGFAIVPGLDDVSEGLVISDVANDTENEGNQFVWIPVDRATFDTKFKRTEGYYDGSLDSIISDCGEADATGINSQLTEDSSVSDEAKLMYASVEANGGFYIGRYEAGKDSNSNLVVKKGANVYNNIGWSNSNTMTNVTGGAVELSRGMYTEKKTSTNENYGVVSMLCYGVQWDTALNFIDSNYITNEVDGKANCSSDSYLVNSTSKGNYNNNAFNYVNASGETVGKESGSSILIPTGSAEVTKVKNIYDMAGNAWEWTMESNSSGTRVVRGR